MRLRSGRQCDRLVYPELDWQSSIDVAVGDLTRLTQTVSIYYIERT